MEWWGAPLPIDASHGLARMAWMRRHRPDVWDRTRWVMAPKDHCYAFVVSAIDKATGEPDYLPGCWTTNSTQRR